MTEPRQVLAALTEAVGRGDEYGLPEAYRAAVEVLRAPAPRTAPAADRPCELHRYHSPQVLRTQGHHRHPVSMQNEVYGRIQDPELLWVCGTDHDSIHEAINWLLGGREPNPRPGRNVLAEARRTVQWYRDAQGETA